MKEDNRIEMDGSLLNNYPYFEEEFDKWFLSDSISKDDAKILYRSLAIKGWNSAIMLVSKNS